MRDMIFGFLRSNFPDNEVLSYEDFIYVDKEGMDILSHLYDFSEDMQKQVYSLLSCPWTEIKWDKISVIGDSWELPGFFNQKSFKYAFPSLLQFTFLLNTQHVDEWDGASALLVDNFIDQLDMASIHQNWKKEFYLSLSHDMRNIIGIILKENPRSSGREVINSYWYM